VTGGQKLKAGKNSDRDDQRPGFSFEEKNPAWRRERHAIDKRFFASAVGAASLKKLHVELVWK
jgi:hypothetical protein